MFNIYSKEIEWGGKTLKIETGKIARQADGAVMISYGDTVVLVTAVGKKEADPNLDFFPLTVHYIEKTYAAGKIPGGYLKRESKPTDHEALVSRLIDRPIRPLFAKNYSNDTQIIAQVMSYDKENPADIVALIGASAALTISGMPFLGPIGAARVGYKDGEYILNPTRQEQEDGSELDLVVSGTRDGVLMVESEASELSEDVMLGAVEFAHNSYQPVIDMIIALAEDCAKEPWSLQEESEESKEIYKTIKEKHSLAIKEGFKIKDKIERYAYFDELKANIIEEFITADAEKYPVNIIEKQFKKLESEIMRHDLIKTGERIDGRDTKTVRPITTEVGLLPRVHGSTLFTRGETQAIVTTTLGTTADEQYVDSLDTASGSAYKEKFMLHYNFPPYSVGEAGRMGPPGRREIGHGKLAWRALKAMMPSDEEFPYTIRLVSEITESNGSSSMATVCGGALALMDAGVPLKKPVAGIAMGLIKEEDDFVVLTDILGDEDHLGDMDFKVAGSKDGVTALQMDIKITSITFEIMKQALEQAKQGRLHILGEMSKSLTKPREELSKYAPTFIEFLIPADKVREVIGQGGSVIREMSEQSRSVIEVTDYSKTQAKVRIASESKEYADLASSLIKEITDDLEVGKEYVGEVVSIKDFGAFVRIGKQDALLHVSAIAEERVNDVNEYLKIGDVIRVVVDEMDKKSGRPRLRYAGVSQEGIPHDNNKEKRVAN